MSAPVTEAHLELAKTVIFSRDSAGRLLTAPMGAQLIADSEARACAQLRRVAARLNKYSANLENDVKYLTQGVPEGDPLFLAVARAERAEAELAASRYETVKAAQDGLRECIRAERAEADANSTRERALTLANSLDEAQAELAAERARLRQLALDACRAAAIVPLVWYPEGYYVNPNDLGKINKQQVDACVAALDAALKEGA